MELTVDSNAVSSFILGSFTLSKKFSKSFSTGKPVKSNLLKKLELYQL